MTSQQELDIAEETILILREAEAAARKEIKESGNVFISTSTEFQFFRVPSRIKRNGQATIASRW